MACSMNNNWHAIVPIISTQISRTVVEENSVAKFTSEGSKNSHHILSGELTLEN